jgi:hypothetical protein
LGFLAGQDTWGSPGAAADFHELELVRAAGGIAPASGGSFAVS